MGILDEIVAHKRIETETLEGQTWTTVPSTRSLHAALSANGLGLIAEVKKKSPTAGAFGNAVDIVSRAKAYEAAGASAISVLTDAKYFGGSLADLRAIADAVSIPVLRKDFTVRVEQLYESRAHGADAVLLMAHVLSESEIKRMLGVCAELGLDALVETHDADSIAMAVRAGAKIIGVNARDFSKDALPICPERFAQLLPLIPDSILKVAESGMKTRNDVAHAETYADGVLIGSSLMANGVAQIPQTISSLLNDEL